MSKVTKAIYRTLFSSGLLVGVYFNIQAAVWIAWGCYSLLGVIYILAHIYFEKVDVSELGQSVTEPWRRILGWFFTATWAATLIYVERYNLLVVWFMVTLLINLLRSRCKYENKKD